MQHLDEHTIDLYVLHSSLLTAGECAAIRSHLETCPACTTLAVRLKEFYRDLENLPAETTGTMEQVLARPRSHLVVFRLVPYRPRPDTTRFHGGYSTVLAAMTPRDQTVRLNETVATMAAEADRMVVRIRREDRAHTYRLYVHTEDPTRRDGMVVSIPNVGDFVVDDQGQVGFEVREEEEPRDWSLLEAVARIPVATVEIPPDRLLDGTSGEVAVNSLRGPVTLRYSCSEGLIALECCLSEGSTTAEFAVCRVPGEFSVLVFLHGGKGAVTLHPSRHPLQVRLYQ